MPTGDTSALDQDVVGSFRTRGWALTRTLDDPAVEQLRAWVADIARWPDDGEGWLHHRERTDHGVALCRTENFIPFHEGIRRLLTEGSMLRTASALLGEDAVLYKEKINYKQPGGAGYAPHQDAPAYPFVARHVSCMVAVDDATELNGCLEVVTGAHVSPLDTDANGCIRQDLVDAMSWTAVPVPSGSTLWFHSLTPHRSGPNRSSVPRRALYPTYNALAEGNLRAAYYEEKLARWHSDDHSSTPGNVRVSLIGDFQGRPA